MSAAINLGHFSDGLNATAGATIRYDLVVTNVGSDVISSVQISSNLNIAYTELLVGGYNEGDLNQDSVFDPLESWVYVSSYTVTQEDIDSDGDTDGIANGALTNTATVIASGPAGTVTDASSVSLPVGEERPGIAISQSGSPNPARAGDTVTFTTTVANTGNISFDELTLTSSPLTPIRPDLIPGTGVNSGDKDRDTIFDIGETWKFTATYTVTQQDITNQGAIDGSADRALTNTVTARANLFGENAVEATTSARVDLVTGQPPKPCPPKPCKPKPPLCRPKPVCKPRPCKGDGFWGGWRPLLGGKGSKKGWGSAPAAAPSAPKRTVFSAGGFAGSSGWSRGGLFGGNRWEWWSGQPVVSDPTPRWGFGGFD